jgi:transposase-like protein
MGLYSRQWLCPHCQSTFINEDGTKRDGMWDLTCLDCEKSFTGWEPDDEYEIDGENFMKD